MKVMRDDSDMLEEYDFSGGIRGKYASRYKEGTNIIMLDPELMEYFPDSTSVNEALRSLANIMKKYKNKKYEQRAQADRQPTVP
ncbi:hypothetical protein [Desulfothermus sp.]